MSSDGGVVVVSVVCGKDGSIRTVLDIYVVVMNSKRRNLPEAFLTADLICPITQTLTRRSSSTARAIQPRAQQLLLNRDGRKSHYTDCHGESTARRHSLSVLVKKYGLCRHVLSPALASGPQGEDLARLVRAVCA